MRVIAGKWRGVPLLAPQGHQTRPVLDQVKEAVFNVLGARLSRPGMLPPCHVVDLFAGTGSFGIEALSRGATHCTFVEKHNKTAEILRQNLEKLEAVNQAAVCVRSAWSFVQQEQLAPQRPGLVFVDPPYDLMIAPSNRQQVISLLGALADTGKVQDDAILTLRTPKESSLQAAELPQWLEVDHRTHGGMSISMMTLSA